MEAKRIKALGIDVDGTLTDGGVYVNAEGRETLKFNRRDGFGIKMLRDSGVMVGAFTSEEDSRAAEERCGKLGIACNIGCKNKVNRIQVQLDRHDISWDEFAYIGDDLNDLEALKRAGFAACPADAEMEIKKVVHLVCYSRGGHGAVREFCNVILGHNRKCGEL